MNLYFLVEGASTEKKFYPALIKTIFNDEINEIATVDQVNDLSNSFFVLSANGYPQIYSHILKHTIEDINNYPLYNYLFICLDADEQSVPERIQEFEEVYNTLTDSGTRLNGNCEVILIVQNRCIETWFLGNSKFYRRNTSNPEMLNFHFFYNVKTNDPELMGYDNDYETHSAYHLAYLKKMISENRQVYSKRKPTAVCDPKYINELIKRKQDKAHLSSFGVLIDKLFQIRQRV